MYPARKLKKFFLFLKIHFGIELCLGNKNLKEEFKRDWRKVISFISQEISAQGTVAKACKAGYKLVTDKLTKKTACVPEDALNAGEEGEHCVSLDWSVCEPDLTCVDGVCKRVSGALTPTPAAPLPQGITYTCEEVYPKLNAGTLTNIFKKKAGGGTCKAVASDTPNSQKFVCSRGFIKVTGVVDPDCHFTITGMGKKLTGSLTDPEYAKYLIP